MLNRLNGKLVKIMGIFFGLFIVVIILLIFFGGDKVQPYGKIEDRMVAAAKKYYADNKEFLPKNNGDKTTVSGLDLESNYMKKLSKMVKQGVICNGEVRVYKFNDEINYVPYLNCGNDYVTKEMYREISKDENLVTIGSGLYKVGDTFVYRGLDVKNYIMFADRLWRIISVDANGNVRLIEDDSDNYSVWDDSYNIEKKSDLGINVFYTNKTEPSDIYTYLAGLIKNEKFIDSKSATKLSYIDVCYGSRAEDNATKDGSAECSIKVEAQVSVLAVYEYLRASLDENCQNLTSRSCSNYNFLATFPKNFWTSTPVSGTTHRVYEIGKDISHTNAAFSKTIRAVINLNPSTIYSSGDGSLNNPYQIK